MAVSCVDSREGGGGRVGSGTMEVKRSQRSCFTQTSCLGEDLGEDSQLEYLSAHEEYEEEKNNSSEFSGQGEVAEVQDMPLMGDKVSPQMAAGQEEPGESESPAQSMAVEPDIPADRSSSGSPGAGNGKRGEALRSIPSVSAAVQAVGDCRAGFPASRSSSAQVCLCSRAVNTEVTMMSKTRPVGWLAQTSVDAASNTEWSFRAQSSHVQVMDTKQEGPPNQSLKFLTCLDAWMLICNF